MIIDLFGSSDFCLPTAEALLKAGYELRLVTTMPPASHKSRVEYVNPVKEFAAAHERPVAEIRSSTNLEQFYGQWAPPACAIVASFGRIIPRALLDIPEKKILNIHPSLLPRHRGPSPVQSTILSGDQKTGVTIILLDHQIDHGPILAVQETAVQPQETAAELKRRLSIMGAELMIPTLKDWIDGSITPTPQDDSQSTMSHKIQKEDGRVDWNQPAPVIAGQWRAFTPWPGIWTTLNDAQGNTEIIKLFDITVLEAKPEDNRNKPGTIVAAEAQRQLVIQAGNYTQLSCGSIQRSGKKRMSIVAFLQGYPELIGKRFE
ncbi:methionyl-tRNA formyltransferase [Candidatus Uhrbacteria bacterium]|nr:methionyl-tRNA formyltransferase [Candidatus Uhrbacteria bacterium]